MSGGADLNNRKVETNNRVHHVAHAEGEMWQKKVAVYGPAMLGDLRSVIWEMRVWRNTQRTWDQSTAGFVHYLST
jgi:hypothetical protein